MRKKIFQLHRRLSIIIAIPVLLWAGSGFMHPIMTNIRPAIATQGIPPVPVDSQRIRFPLAAALHRHHLDSISNFRLVHIDTNWFYQVQPVAPSGHACPPVPIYISCTNGNVLIAGDWLYAQYLARQFLEGPAPYTSPRHETPGPASIRQTSGPITLHQTPGPASLRQTSGPARLVVFADPVASVAHDCCGAATETVLNPVKGAKVANVSVVSEYDHEYKNINRLLPVYRVSFERADGIRVYVETSQDRFSFAMDNRRAIFDEIFRLFHTWGWLDALGKGRLVVEMLVALTALFTALLGIYIFFTTRAPRSTGNAHAPGSADAPVDNPRSAAKARRNHRYTAIVASLFTLFWTFSGSFHAFSKFRDDDRNRYFICDHFPAEAAAVDYTRLQIACSGPITNLSLVKMEGETWWRVSLLPAKTTIHKDLMKEMKAPMAPVSYIRTSDYSVLPDGDARYAVWMATCFSGHPVKAIRNTEPITAFSDEYNFTDKRLPVWKISYDLDQHTRYYVETSSGKLASLVDDRIAMEGYSFSVFHKHHFMDWGGKTVRDASTMFWAFAQVTLVVIGLILWFKRVRG